MEKRGGCKEVGRATVCSTEWKYWGFLLCRREGPNYGLPLHRILDKRHTQLCSKADVVLTLSGSKRQTTLAMAAAWPSSLEFKAALQSIGRIRHSALLFSSGGLTIVGAVGIAFDVFEFI